MQNLSKLNNQKGASVTSVVLFFVVLGLVLKLGYSMIPAYVGNYQFTKLVAQELKRANDDKQDEKEFFKNLDRQLGLNASYNFTASDRLVVLNNKPGALAVKTKYEEVSKFYGSTFIVNHFEEEISPADAE